MWTAMHKNIQSFTTLSEMVVRAGKVGKKGIKKDKEQTLIFLPDTSGKLKIFLLDLLGLFENKPNKPL